MAKAKRTLKMKSLIPIDNDIAPLFKAEKNKTRIVNDLLRTHYMSAPVGGVEEIDSEPSNVQEPISTPSVTKSENPPLAIDGRIDDSVKEFVGGDPNGIVFN